MSMTVQLLAIFPIGEEVFEAMLADLRAAREIHFSGILYHR